jgi:hypothetical protein
MTLAITAVLRIIAALIERNNLLLEKADPETAAQMAARHDELFNYFYALLKKLHADND